MNRTNTIHYLTHYCVFFLWIFLFWSCNDSLNENAGVAYLGGEIINPKSEIVVVFNKDNSVSDTIKLDANNRFIHKLENVSPSVYSFFHGGEYQLVILEPNDSIMLRLNTFDFKSLVFTGNGARKNDYLIKTYLDNEERRQALPKYSQKDPEVFDSIMKSMHDKDLKALNTFIAKKDISDFAKKIIKSNIDYHYYANREIYPFIYFGNNKLVHVMDLPENFYGYRKYVDYNDVELSEVYDYNRFISSHIDNLALNDYYKKQIYHSTFDRNELNYNLAKLDLIDSLVNVDEIKNRMLKFKARYFINHSGSNDEVSAMLNHFMEKSTSEDDKIYLQNHVASIKKLRPGELLPDFKLININNEVVDILSLIDKPTLIYFWSSNNIQHYRNSHYRVKELRDKFPGMSFMSINTNDNSYSYWKEIFDKYKFTLQDEYRFENPQKTLKTLAVNYVNKGIIVDENAHIVLPNVNIFNDDFETILKDLK